MRLTFSEADHVYKVDGRPVRSVSQVITKAGMGTDYSTVDPSILERAQWRGIHVDVACNLLDEGDLDWDTVHPAWRGYVEGYAAWKQRDWTRTGTVCSQRMVYHPKLDYAGTLDKLLLGVNLAVIADIKTSKTLHVNPYGLQLAAYAMPGILMAVEDGELIPGWSAITDRWLLHLTPKRCIKHVCTDADDFQDFIACLHPDTAQSQQRLAARRDRYAMNGTR